MPDSADNQRARDQLDRYLLVSEQASELVQAYMETALGDDLVEHWGAPDTALNPMASSTRQLTTPGLYGRHPLVASDGSAAAEALVGARGYLDRAQVWARAQVLQYLAVGVGIVFRRLSWSEDGGGRILDRLVHPHDVWVRTDLDDPMMIRELSELRVRDGYYTWDVWDLDTPSWRIYQAKQDGTRGKLIRDMGTGESYPYRDEEGRPYLPWVTYRATDTGGFWPIWRRSMHIGTLRACSYFTYVGHSAMFATGKHLFLGGVDPATLPGVKRESGDKLNQVPYLADRTPTETMRIHPGTVTAVRAEAGSSITAIEVGPGVEIADLSNFANLYTMLLHQGDGLHPSDVTRQSANPTSGAALEISAASRREFALQVLPWFEASDLEMIRICALLLTGAGRPTPTDGYSITYHTIPLSPTEQEDMRADLEWQVAQGQISPIDVHLRLHPGKSREQARIDIMAARAEIAELAAAPIIEETTDAGRMPALQQGDRRLRAKEPAGRDPDEEQGAGPGEQGV